ncbi:MAG: hypothetical protein JWM16_5332 [Verrucomicrobiales bacterium]|nr:hypothetical protein [Verrucomicrobiales bacterium]
MTQSERLYLPLNGTRKFPNRERCPITLSRKLSPDRITANNLSSTIRSQLRIATSLAHEVDERIQARHERRRNFLIFLGFSHWWHFALNLFIPQVQARVRNLIKRGVMFCRLLRQQG